MNSNRIYHPLYDIYTYEDTVQIDDNEVDLTFLRTRNENNLYDISVIHKNESICNWPLEAINNGFCLYEDITLKEWIKLAKDYMKHRNQSKKIFESFLEENLWKVIREHHRLSDLEM
jgi:hypothetical protein